MRVSARSATAPGVQPGHRNLLEMETVPFPPSGALTSQPGTQDSWVLLQTRLWGG